MARQQQNSTSFQNHDFNALLNKPLQQNMPWPRSRILTDRKRACNSNGQFNLVARAIRRGARMGLNFWENMSKKQRDKRNVRLCLAANILSYSKQLICCSDCLLMSPVAAHIKTMNSTHLCAIICANWIENNLYRPQNNRCNSSQMASTTNAAISWNDNNFSLPSV